MRSRRWAHAAVVVATVTGLVGGAGATPAATQGSAVPPTPAGRSDIESSDVPALVASPDRFAVAPFENRARVRAFDWLVAGAPFEIATKTEAVFGLEATGGSLFVGGKAVPAEAAAVAELAATHDARWVITGWVERPNWELRLGITLWRVEKGSAKPFGEAERTGPVATYHTILGEVLGEVWSEGGQAVDVARREKLVRPLARDLYAVTLLGRGLGHLTGALPTPSKTGDPRTNQLRQAEHDLERSVFIDPKCHEAQRLVGELYRVLAVARSEPRFLARAAGKFNYAHDLAPEDLQALRAAAEAAATAHKHELARSLFRTLVTRRPWDVDARYRLGAAMWSTGDGAAAERQLEQVTARHPEHLAARRVLVLIHASRSDTQKLVSELRAIAKRAPDDLEVKADLATGYGALGQWEQATAELEAIAAARPPDLALLIRIGDGHRRRNQLDVALAWYTRAARLAPESSLPGFAAAQAQYDAAKLAEATRTYQNLQKFPGDLAAAEQALGVIALRQGRANEAAWYLRRATRAAPRDPRTWRALVASEIARKDAPLALDEVGRALATWPDDAELLYLAGVAHALAGDRALARARLVAAVAASTELAPARVALGALDAGGTVTLAYTPALVRPWGDAHALQEALERYALITSTMAAVRVAYETQYLTLLGAVGKGPHAPVKGPAVRTCPIGRIAPLWASAQAELRRYERLGGELEADYRYLARHHEVGVTAGLLPDARTRVAGAKKTYRTALADIAELRAQWTRGLAPELRLVGCSDKLLAAAVAQPERYRVIVEDEPVPIPERAPQRARPRATFYVDNTRCADPVDVWIDGAQLGQVAPGRRSALVADGGERTLCLLGPGSAQCGDRGTVRQAYLHDGWSVTVHCPK